MTNLYRKTKIMKTKNIILLLMFAMLFSCSSPIIHRGLWKLKKGINTAEVINIVEDNSGTKLIEVDGKSASAINVPNVTNKYAVVIGQKYMYLNYQYYIFAFENDKLIYWGTPLEFSRHTSPLINQIGELSIPLIEKDM